MFESLFSKIAGLTACNFIKKRLQHKYFAMNFRKFWKTPILENTSDGCFLKGSVKELASQKSCSPVILIYLETITAEDAS